MSTYKMVALDMDGTLLNDQHEISEANLQALHDCLNRGIIVCLSTGRGMRNVAPYLKQIGPDLPAVTVNGSEVWERLGRLHSRTALDTRLIMTLHEWAVRHNIWYWAYDAERVYNRETWCSNPEEIEWLKFGVYTEDVALLQELRAMAEEMDSFEITNSHPFNLEFNPKGVSKATGLRQVCQLYGLSMDEVVAMGDSLNDIAMIREAGLGVAMGNAQDEVKRIADRITLSNTEDGVAYMIRNIVLQEA